MILFVFLFESFNDVVFFIGLLLQGDNNVQLVVLCAEKPTTLLLKSVVTELPNQLKKISDEYNYTVTMAPVDGAVLVTDGTITVKVSLTSPLLREQGILFFLHFWFFFLVYFWVEFLYKGGMG